MTEYKPLVSVITITYNSEISISATIESVILQTYQNIEYIIIDGNSIDKTNLIIKSYLPKLRNRNIETIYISEKDNGIYDAMNKGILHSNGEIIHILNSDDIYTDINILDDVVREINNFDMIACNTMLKYKNGIYRVKKAMMHSYLFIDTPFMHPSLFVKKKVYDSIGNFNEKYRIAGDVDFIFRTFTNGLKYNIIDKNAVLMEAGGNSDKYFLLGKKEYYKSYHSNFKNPIGFFLGFIYNLLIYLYKIIRIK